jgi:hypothetical protein
VTAETEPAATQPADGGPESTGSWRGLVAVTTCQREPMLRRCLPQLARACQTDQRLALVVALDGDEIETRSFCERWHVPLIYSQKREGVGVSKNRILKCCPEFDYYFFLEDDVEVIDGNVFAEHVKLSQATGIQHFSLEHPRSIRARVGVTRALGHEIVHASYGGAIFNFFTREALQRVGGWHPLFAQYRRYGHTEHSYRVARAGLAPAPFNTVLTLVDTCIWHTPPAVTRVDAAPIDENGIAAPERALMREHLDYCRICTPSPYTSSSLRPGQLNELAAVLTGSGRYPLLSRREHRHAMSDYYAARFDRGRGRLRRSAYALASFVAWPGNLSLRHVVKMELASHIGGAARTTQR